MHTLSFRTSRQTSSENLLTQMRASLKAPTPSSLRVKLTSAMIRCRASGRGYKGRPDEEAGTKTMSRCSSCGLHCAWSSVDVGLGDCWRPGLGLQQSFCAPAFNKFLMGSSRVNMAAFNAYLRTKEINKFALTLSSFNSQKGVRVE